MSRRYSPSIVDFDGKCRRTVSGKLGFKIFSILLLQDNAPLAETEITDLSAITLDDTPSTSQCNNSTRSRIGFNQIFSSIRSPFSKMFVSSEFKNFLSVFLGRRQFQKVAKRASGMLSQHVRLSSCLTTKPTVPTLN